MQVIWNGSMRDTYLCIPDPEPDTYEDRPFQRASAPAPAKRGYVRRRAMRDRILGWLADGQMRSASEIKTLLGNPSTQVFWGVIDRARRDGVIAPVRRRGYLEKGRR